MTIDVHIRVESRAEMVARIDGVRLPRAYLPATGDGHHSVEVIMPPAISEN
jgi:hypothetical protein